MNFPTNVLLGALFLCMSTMAQAQLAWEKTELDLNPAPGADAVVATFKYQNKGTTPINIKAVRTSCGCTTAALAKNDVAPGEKGEIVATLKIGDRTGMQQKTVTVETDDPKAPSTVLTFKALIAQILDLQPAFVFWQANDKPEPKAIVAKAGKGVAIKSLEVTSSIPDFTAKVEALPNGDFKINVTPRETSHPITANLTIKPDSPVAAGKVFTASARVLPPAVPAAQAPPAPGAPPAPAAPTTSNH